MGTWGYAAFDNDEASDFVYDLEESEDLSILTEALAGMIPGGDLELQAPECSVAIAAAEVVAALNGRPAPDLPADVAAWAKGKPRPDPRLVAQARQALEAILQDSELKELWQENKADFPQWLAGVEDLKRRLG
ncbi:MAG: DUF4259 domain-containing protein [Planctomycetes bacterium]|nr:DUF4259 domain-containing protein [Planctomycetota bacterium]